MYSIEMNNYYNHLRQLNQTKSVEKSQGAQSKIFRPWDNSEKLRIQEQRSVKIENDVTHRTYQDNTISTTTEILPGNHRETPPAENSCQSKHEPRNFKCSCTTPALTEGHRNSTKYSLNQSTNNSDNESPVASSKLKTNERKDHRIKTMHVSKDNNFFRNHAIANTDLIPSPELNHPNITPELNPDLFVANHIDPVQIHNEMLAQSLGLASTDSLFLETLAQGYAMEEYARILTQEHQAKMISNRKQRPKKYKCPHCDVGFSNNGQLKGHIRIHTGERPFRCDEKNCGKTFTRNEELTRHKRIHSGLRPFPCTTCGKRFGRKDHLKKHARTHVASRGLHMVPVVLPATAWASLPPSAGIPAYGPYMPMYGYR